MKRTLMVIMSMLFLAQLVSAHTIQREFIIRSDGNYNIQFSTEPEYPLAQRLTHLDFEIWDNSGKTVSGLNLELEIMTPTKSLMINARELHGHYEAEQVFESYGEHTIIPYVNDERLDTSFTLYVDGFQRGGWWKVGVIFFFLIVLFSLMYKDCRGEKRG